MFKIFDKNHDHWISVKEFIIGYAISNTKDVEKRLEYTFTLFDIDGNGFLTKNEIIHAVDVAFQFQGKSLNSFDTEAIRKVFESLDSSKDGKISKSTKLFFS